MYITLFHGNEVNTADEVVTGYLYDAHNYAYTLFDTYSYDITTKKFQSNQDTWRQENIGKVNADIIDVTFSAYDYGTKLKPDTILHAEFVPSGEFEDVHAFFYIRSPYSNIVNGVLHPDNTFSGDYALIYNNNNNTDKIIDNSNKIYDMLFTISSGDIKAKLDDFIADTSLENYGDLGIEEAILGILDDEPSDFIIAWNNIYIPNLKDNTPTKIISGDSINFSAIARNNVALGTAMTYTRTIMGYTIIILMIHNIWKTLMIALGVGVALYEENEEEKDRMELQTTDTYNVYEDGTYQRTVSTWNPRNRTRINSMFRRTR